MRPADAAQLNTLPTHNDTPEPCPRANRPLRPRRVSAVQRFMAPPRVLSSPSLSVRGWGTAMQKLRIVAVGISGGRSLTRPFRDSADFPLDEFSPYSHVHVRRECLGFVHRSKAICRPVPNLSATIRNCLIAVCMGLDRGWKASLRSNPSSPSGASFLRTWSSSSTRWWRVTGLPPRLLGTWRWRASRCATPPLPLFVTVTKPRFLARQLFV